MILAEGRKGARTLRIRGGVPQRGLVELDRLVDREPLVRARARDHRVAHRRGANSLAFGRIGPGRAVVVLVDRQAVVVADHPRQLGLRVVGDPFEPGCDRRVRTRALNLRHRSVRSVAQESVLEAQLDLAGEARCRVGRDQVALREPPQRVADVRCAKGSPDGPFPEDPTDDRSLLKHPALGERQTLDAGNEHSLERIRDCRAFAALFDEVADGLLQEERVALRPGDDARSQVVAEHTRREERIDQACALVDVKRRDLDRFEALGGHEVGLPAEECRSRRRDEEEWAIQHRCDRR